MTPIFGVSQGNVDRGREGKKVVWPFLFTSLAQKQEIPRVWAKKNSLTSLDVYACQAVLCERQSPRGDYEIN